MKAYSEVKSMKDETRIALLEQTIGHINDAIIRIEKRFDMIDSRFDRMEKRIDKLSDDIKEGFIQVNNKIDSNFKWLLSMTIGGFMSVLGILAHAVHWI